MIKKILQDPLFLFLSGGLTIFTLYGYVAQNTATTISMSPQNREAQFEEFEALTGRPVSEKDASNIERSFVEEEILFREALDSGMHLTNPEVRSALVEDMRYRISGILPEPDEAAMVSYYLENMDRYYVEQSYDFQHVFFKDKPQNADPLLVELRQGKTVTGDEFWRGLTLPDYGASMIRTMFGQEFLKQLSSVDENVWFGPIESKLGWHYVIVTGQKEPRPLSFDAVKMQVKNDYLADVLSDRSRQYMEEIANKYTIEWAFNDVKKD